jgi:hypothetical protein
MCCPPPLPYVVHTLTSSLSCVLVLFLTHTIASLRSLCCSYHTPQFVLFLHLPPTHPPHPSTTLPSVLGGTQVANWGSDNLVWLPEPGNTQQRAVLMGGHGPGDGQFVAPIGVVLVPGLGLVVREVNNGGRFQVFVRRSGDGEVWGPPCTLPPPCNRSVERTRAITTSAQLLRGARKCSYHLRAIATCVHVCGVHSLPPHLLAPDYFPHTPTPHTLSFPT